MDSEKKVFNNPSLKHVRQVLRRNPPQPEMILWAKLRREQLLGFKFRRQHGIGRYIVDYYCHKAKLVIEIDGDSHFRTGAKKRDKLRDCYMKMHGLTVLRFTNSDMSKNIDGVLERIMGVLTPSGSPLRKGEK